MINYFQNIRKSKQIHKAVNTFFDININNKELRSQTYSFVYTIKSMPNHKGLFKNKHNGVTIKFNPFTVGLFVIILSLALDEFKRHQYSYDSAVSGIYEILMTIDLEEQDPYGVFLLYKMKKTFLKVLEQNGTPIQDFREDLDVEVQTRSDSYPFFNNRLSAWI